MLKNIFKCINKSDLTIVKTSMDGPSYRTKFVKLLPLFFLKFSLYKNSLEFYFQANKLRINIIIELTDMVALKFAKFLIINAFIID